MTSMLDVLTCLVVASALFPLGVWGRYQAENLVVDAVEGEEREIRIAVLRRGSLTCQVLAVVFTAVAFWLLTID